MPLLIALVVIIVGWRMSGCGVEGHYADCSEGGAVQCIDFLLRVQLERQARASELAPVQPERGPYLEEPAPPAAPQTIGRPYWTGRFRPRGLPASAYGIGRTRGSSVGELWQVEYKLARR